MDGVTILQTIEKYQYNFSFNSLGIFSILTGAIILAYGIYLLWVLDDDFLGKIIGSLGIAMVVSGFIVCSISGKVVCGYKYQVLIDDTVSMQEFTAKYNILEQQGITYIVEEKEEGD